MSESKKSKMRFLLIIPLLVGVIFFVTSMTSSDMVDEDAKREQLLTQFAINYDAMMSACSEDNLDSEDLKSCLDAFDEVREFCTDENADQCGDEQMDQLEQKLSEL